MYSNIHDDSDPGTLKFSPETFGVSHYKVTLSLHPLIAIDPFLFSVYRVLTFMDFVIKGSFALWTSLEFDQLEEMTEYQRM